MCTWMSLMASITPNNCVMELIFSAVEELFRVGQIKEDNSPPILKIMEKDPASKRSFEIASRWLKNCVESHSSCRPPTEFQKPPRRLIHVGNKTQNPFLVETFPDLQHVEWLSLSYCVEKWNPFDHFRCYNSRRGISHSRFGNLVHLD